MKKQEKQLLQNKSVDQLQSDLNKAKLDLANLRLEHKSNQLKNTSSLARTRNKIAILKTIISQKANQEKKA